MKTASRWPAWGTWLPIYHVGSFLIVRGEHPALDMPRQKLHVMKWLENPMTKKSERIVNIARFIWIVIFKRCPFWGSHPAKKVRRFADIGTVVLSASTPLCEEKNLLCFSGSSHRFIPDVHAFDSAGDVRVVNEPAAVSITLPGKGDVYSRRRRPGDGIGGLDALGCYGLLHKREEMNSNP